MVTAGDMAYYLIQLGYCPYELAGCTEEQIRLEYKRIVGNDDPMPFAQQPTDEEL